MISKDIIQKAILQIEQDSINKNTDFFCSTRDVLQTRIDSFANKSQLYLQSAILGEIGNNTFDHNWDFEQGKMNIQINKFGDVLMSRPAGRESFLKAKAYIFCDLCATEKISLDFTDVKVLTPSWADEFITGIKNTYKNTIELINTENNESVKTSLKYVSL